MVNESTSSTAEALSAARCSVHATARATRLRTVLRWHLDERSAIPAELVPQQFSELRPTGARDAASAVTSYHARNVELFDHDNSVGAGNTVSTRRAGNARGHAHHETGNGRGKGQKAPDSRTMPMSFRAHREFHDAKGYFEYWTAEARRIWQDVEIQRVQELFAQYQAGARFLEAF